MSTGRPLRATAVLLASLTAVFGVALAGPAAAQTSPQTTTGSAQAAAGWLARQMTDGSHFEGSYDPGTGPVTFPDYGLTADAVLAFGAADVAQDFADAATDWLAQPDNVTANAGNGSTDSFVGPLAKLALVAIVQGEDPRAFGEGAVDLLERLAARQNPDSGRFSDLSSFEPPPGQTNDFSNGITQSLAIIALLRDDADADVTKAVEYLEASQCDDGGFPLWFEQAECSSDVDTTGFAIQALLVADRDAGDALDFLEQAQDKASGGFHGSPPTTQINANSTGLATQALRVGDRAAAADAAVGYLHGQQIGCAGPAEQRGAIAYDADGFQASNAARATAQALYGLTGVGLAEVDAAGDVAGAPVLDCPPAPEPDEPPAQQPPAQQPPAQGSSGATELPATGVAPAPAAGFGVLLVLSGALVLWASRRRDVALDGERP